jgi:lipopolysaccharide transport system ATP-binding protein
VDEVLAVGDAAFQKKCLGKMGDVVKQGRTILFVSHNMSAIRALCRESLWIDVGEVITRGPTPEVLHRYLESPVENQKVSVSDRRDRTGDGSARICSLSITTEHGQLPICTDSRLKITVTYTSHKSVRRPRIYVSIFDMSYLAGVYALDSEATGDLPKVLPPGGTLTCITEPIKLTPGRCYANVGLCSEGVEVDHVTAAVCFDVEAAPSAESGKGPSRDWVICTLGYRWSASEG